MKNFDVMFFHPPRTMLAYQRELPLISTIISKIRNEIAVPEYSVMPMGLTSLASALEKEGFEAKVVNLGLKRQLNPSFNIERYIKSLSVKVFAINLNWVFHANSALEIAQKCKRLHPNSLVVIGGLTATWFVEEIMRKYPFIDAVLLGECEGSIVKLVENHLKGEKLDDVDGIFFRDESRLKVNPIKAPPKSLDLYDFTDFNLIEDRKEYFKTDIAGFSPQKPPSAWLPIARGCIYNCIFCGGGKEAYSRLTKREEITFRSPNRIYEDVQSLVDQGVQTICFSHDPQLGGEKYYKEIFSGIRKMRVDASAYIEVFQLPTKNFIKQLTETFTKVNIAISPETGSESLRNFLGKSFTNRDLLKAVNESIRNGIFPAMFFTPGFPGETRDSFTSTLEMIDKLVRMCPYLAVSCANAYTIDPNCLMALNPEKYGIKLFFKSLEDYRRLGRKKRLKIIDLIGHETSTLKRQEIASLVVEALKFTRKT